MLAVTMKHSTSTETAKPLANEAQPNRSADYSQHGAAPSSGRSGRGEENRWWESAWFQKWEGVARH